MLGAVDQEDVDMVIIALFEVWLEPSGVPAVAGIIVFVLF